MMSAYSRGIEISRRIRNNLGNSYSIYRFVHHNHRDSTNYQLFTIELKECYTTIYPDTLSKSLVSLGPETLDPIYGMEMNSWQSCQVICADADVDL